MVRLNLQLFAQQKKNTSIVDYLKGQGRDSSYAARKELAKSFGIQDYSGTAEQNTKMLSALQTGGSLKVAASNPVNTANKSTQKANGTTAKTSVTAPNTAGAGANIKGVDQGTLNAMNTPFTASTAYQDAMKYTNSLLEQLSSGRTSYTDQIKSLMGQIQNRDAFEYDVESDMLFQQSLASAMSSGKTAMQDSMGQAAALTGGYGSTYSQAVGNQAYNAYIEEAYANLPEYYQLALEAYQMEGQEMYDQLAMLNTADAQEYQRMYDSWSTNFSNAQQMYQNEYTAWQDEVANAFNLANMANSDYWNGASLAEQQRQFNQEMAYKNSALKQDNEQYYASLAAEMASGSGDVDYAIDEEDMMKYKQEAEKVFNQYGEANAVAYIETLPDEYKEEVLGFMQSVAGADGYQNTFKADVYSSYVEEDDVPLEYREWTLVNDKKAKDQFGNTFKLEELPESVRKKLKQSNNTVGAIGGAGSIFGGK